MRAKAFVPAVAASWLLVAVAAPAQTPHRRGTGQRASRSSSSPELVGILSKELHVTPKQAEGGAGAVFSYAKKKLPAEDYAKVAAVVPGIDDLTNRAPEIRGDGILSSLENVSGSEMGGTAGAAVALAPAFGKLGMSGETVLKFIPVIVQYVGNRGGTGTADVLEGALR